MKKKVIERAVPGFFIGIAIGQIISVLISLMSGNGEFIICTDEFIAQIGNEALAAAVKSGKALYVGVSNYDAEATARAYDILKGMGIVPAPKEDWDVLPQSRLKETIGFFSNTLSKAAIKQFFK